MLTSLGSSKKLEEWLRDSWVPVKSIMVTNPKDLAKAERIEFIVDTGASMSYISLKDSQFLGFRSWDCFTHLEVSGIIVGSEKLCVVEVIIEVKGKDYKTIVQIGNAKTSETNLLGRFKFLDYFTNKFRVFQ